MVSSTNPIIESPSGWSYRQVQENGDQVDCNFCGDPLDDDFPIVNDSEGYAYHEQCLTDADDSLVIHQYVGTLPDRTTQVLIRVYGDGSGTIQFRRHFMSGWGETSDLERQEV
jgi:hypothetical protein